VTVHLVNPSHVSFGIGVITPRWLYVLAAATPDSYGEPAIVDETLETLDLSTIKPATSSESAYTPATHFAAMKSVLRRGRRARP
jgi:hypothetical protein